MVKHKTYDNKENNPSGNNYRNNYPVNDYRNNYPGNNSETIIQAIIIEILRIKNDKD